MDPRLKKIRIPTALAFVLLALGVGVTMILIQRGTFVVSEAAPDYTPKDVRVSNITGDSFVVSYVTSDSAVGAVKINGENPVLDSRGKALELKSHYFEIDGLSSSTSYSFSIISGGEEYTDGSYKATTGPTFSSGVPENVGVGGTVLLPEGGGAVGSVVYLRISGSQLLSATTDGEGKYNFNFGEGIRTEDLKGVFLLEEEDLLALEAVRGDLSAKVSTYYKALLPPITLSRTFDFTSTQEDVSQGTGSGVLSIPTPVVSFSDFSVLSPVEGDFSVDEQPEISGTAAPDTRVSISFEPSGIKDNVAVDESGRWSYRTKSPLPQGENALTAVGVGSGGISESVVVRFQVFPSGSRVTQNATPSATPIVAATPTPTLIPSPTPTQPVKEASPSPILTLSPSPTPSPTPWITVTPTAPGNLGGVVLTFASLAFIVTGATLLFLLG